MTAEPVHRTGPPPILKAKLGRPVLPHWVIARDELSARFEDGVRGPLTVVTGPPGAGKTVAAAAWAAGRAGGPVAWISLESADHEPETFWEHVLAALETAGIAGLPASERPFQGEVLRAGLAAALAERSSPAVLVLDDFHPPAGSCLAGDLDRVLRDAWPGLRLVLISRTDPPLPLHRHRLAGALTEIRSDALAFGEREVRGLLAHHGVALTAGSVRALRRRTEGWAAGLRLAAMSMEGHPDPDAFAAAFAGDDRAVVDYLMAEVLDAQPRGIRRLLLTLGVLDRFNAELAAELAGPCEGRLFAALVRQNAFVLPLGHGWYRYHHVFGAALHLTLCHEDPVEASRLHRRVADWYDRHGRVEDAVRHALLAADWPYACRLIVGGLAIGRLLGLAGPGPLGALPEDAASRALAGTVGAEQVVVAAAL
ncbi:AAA family ATPase, partial [Actinomadura fibrosa]